MNGDADEGDQGQLSIEHLTVDFGSQRALDGVDVTFRRGEIHALLGPNGSGKSTLIKTMSGAVTPRPSAVVSLRDQRFEGGLSPAECRRLGLRFVHQDLALIPDESVIENLYLSNAYPTTLGQIRWRAARNEAAAALQSVGLDLRPKATLRTLRHVDRVLVAVARALMQLPDDGGFLFVDEPTAALGEADSVGLLESLRHLATKRGIGVVLVTHRIREVLRFADDVTILRDGRVELRAQRNLQTSEDEILDALGIRPGERGRARISTEQISMPNLPASTAEVSPVIVLQGLTGTVVRDIDLLVRPAEIMGVTGLEGSGKEELFQLLSGGQRPVSGTMTVLGSSEVLTSASDVLRRGAGIIPGDRQGEGGIAELTVAENLFLPKFAEFKSKGLFHSRAMRKRAGEQLGKYGVEPPLPDKIFGTLSGGNQQKTILARWLSSSPPLLILQEPTAGVDVASRERIYAELRGAVAGGMGVIVISSDVTELTELCQRVVVMVDGRIEAEFSGPYLNEANLTQASFETSRPKMTGTSQR